MPYIDDIIPLSCQLLDGDATKYVNATIKRPGGSELTGSPFPMDNIGGGKYSLDTVLMPNEDYIEVTYGVFDDAGYSIPSDDHLLGTDVFRLEIPDTVLVEKLDQIIAKLNGLALPGASIHATLVQNKISEIVQDLTQVKALASGDKTAIAVEKSDSLASAVPTNKITAQVID